MKRLKAIVIGAGGRGMGYAKIMAAAPEKYDIVAVADPIKERCKVIGELFGISEDMYFDSWEPLLEKGKIADFAIIATNDRDHFYPTMAAIEAGYDILLEKPVSSLPSECKIISEHAKKYGSKVVVCHVLRYTPLYSKLKELLESGIIGDIVSVNHEECIWNLHFCHSFVRGIHSNSIENSTLLLQKCCHDMDIIQWLIGKKCKKVQSFGSLNYFCEKNAPEGAADYCLNDCPHYDTCMYSVKNAYLTDDIRNPFKDGCTGTPNPTYEEKEKSLRTSKYGRCAFKSNNDVCDRQTVNLLFEDNITATFSFTAFNRSNRWTHITGTKGELHANLTGYVPIEHFDLVTREKNLIPVNPKDGAIGGHGGGDQGIVDALYDYMLTGKASSQISEIGISCDNHMIVFAAEKSRLEGTVVDLDEYISQISC